MESKVYDKAYKFAIRIVKGYKYLCETKQEYVLSKQLLRSGTSIGYKECLETKYWLSLLKDTNYIGSAEKVFRRDRVWGVGCGV